MKLLSPKRSKIIRVLVADSNQMQSQLLSNTLRRQRHFRVMCCRRELSHCLDILRAANVDIVLLGDGSTNKERLIEMLRGLHASYAHVPVILLLDSYDRDLVVDAMRGGARGLFCLSQQPFRALCRCISTVYEGQLWANAEQIGYLIEALNSAPQTSISDVEDADVLTLAEDQIVRFVSREIGDREISRPLKIKEITGRTALLRDYDS